MFDAGHILVDLCERRDERLAVTVCNTRTGEIPMNLMKPASRANARRLMSLVYGLCPLAHLNAFDAARAAARGISAGELRDMTEGFSESALVAEALVENLRVMTLSLEQLLPAGPRIAESVETAKRFGALRGKILALVRLAGSLDPLACGALPQDWDDANNLLNDAAAELAAAFEAMLFGMHPEKWLAGPAADPAALEAWADEFRAKLPAAAWIAHVEAMGGHWGAVECSLLPRAPAVMEELGARMLLEQGFALAPRWRGTTRLTGAYARAASSERFKPFAERGPDAFTLAAARLMETALGLTLLDGSASVRCRRFFALEAAGTPCTASAKTAEGFVGTAESARGLLTHAVSVDDMHEPVRLVITSPTEWQFAPEGPAARAAARYVKSRSAVDLKDPAERSALEARLREVLFGLDACVPILFQHRTNGGPLHA